MHGYNNPQIEIKNITPHIAAQMLLRNTSNRPLKKFELDKIMLAMIEGRFELNGETIKIAKNGDILDGQHRLIACVKTGVSFQSIIVSNLDNKAYLTIDIGSKRSNSDALAKEGVANYNAAAGALRWIISIEKNKHMKVVNLTPDQAVVEFNKRQTLPHSVSYGTAARKMLHPSMGSAAHYLFSQKDRVAADKFFDDLISGENLTSSDPVLALRNKLISIKLNANRKFQISVQDIMSMTIRAWNARRQGRTMRQVKGMVENSAGDHSIPKII